MADHFALYALAEIRDIEHAALSALAPGTLMRRAGQAAAERAMTLTGAPQTLPRVLVFAGPGNNGGDALEAACLLSHAGLRVCVLMYADPEKYSPDAQLAYQHAKRSHVDFADPARLPELASPGWSLVVDGLFGIGLSREISGPARAAVEAINRLRCPVLALDVPSGLDSDTGSIVGAGNGIAVRATHTITFIGDKPGLHTAFGRDYAGDVKVATLQVERALFPSPSAFINHVGLFEKSLRVRRHNSHKGSYGDVAIIGGAQGMAGAAVLSGTAALKCGAGRVFVGFLEAPPPYDSGQPELMCRPAGELEFSRHTLVVGPGLGASPAAAEAVLRALQADAPLVLDADALNLTSGDPGLQQALAQRSPMAIITPHPLEAARLLGTTNTVIQANRLAAARELARRFNAVAILKGSGTIIARPDQTVAVNTTGNPGLASAGTGDVLAGICGALLAQGWPQWETALAAAWLHGHAADMLVAQGIGPIGMSAGELIPCVRMALNQITSKHAAPDAAR